MKHFLFILLVGLSYASFGQIDPFIQDSLARVYALQKAAQTANLSNIDTAFSNTADRGINKLKKDTSYVSVYLFSAWTTMLNQMQSQQQQEVNQLQQMIADCKTRWQNQIKAAKISFISSPPVVPPKLN